jgi:hypothetical protein
MSNVVTAQGGFRLCEIYKPLRVNHFGELAKGWLLTQNFMNANQTV